MSEIKTRIAAVASIPRMGFQDHFGCLMAMLHQHGIPYFAYSGAFWHKGIQNALMDTAKTADWILCTDYDTVATAYQLDILLKTFGNNPHMDALAAFQCRRGTGTPLFTVKDEKTGKFRTNIVCEEPIKAYTAHFGLTLIRTKSLLEMPKPWFLSVPDDKGEWGSESTDADIYFWKKWAELGKTLYVEPNCRIGHMELMVSQPDDFMLQRHMSITRWRELFMPGGQENTLGEREDTTR